jgi:integrase
VGSVYRLKNSSNWWMNYKGADGKRYQESTRMKRKTDALRVLRDREGRVVRGEPVTPQVSRTTFADAAADVIRDFRINGKKSLDEVERRIRKHLMPFFGAWRLTDITPATVRTYIEKRQADTIVSAKARRVRHRDGTVTEIAEVRRQVSPAEINRELQVLKRAFSLAIQSGKALHRPYIPMLKEARPRSGFVDREQLQRISAHLPPHVRAVVEFAFHTGWRLYSEVLPLQWRQVDFSAGEVRLDPGTTKNGEGRTFPMTVELWTLLNAQRAATDRLQNANGQLIPWVFHREGAPIKSITHAWQSACLSGGCPTLIPHDLRRSAVRHFVRSGIPERVAMQLTGHKTRSVFERYNIVSEGDLKTAADRLNSGSHAHDAVVGQAAVYSLATRGRAAD